MARSARLASANFRVPSRAATVRLVAPSKKVIGEKKEVRVQTDSQHGRRREMEGAGSEEVGKRMSCLHLDRLRPRYGGGGAPKKKHRQGPSITLRYLLTCHQEDVNTAGFKRVVSSPWRRRMKRSRRRRKGVGGLSLAQFLETSFTCRICSHRRRLGASEN